MPLGAVASVGLILTVVNSVLVEYFDVDTFLAVDLVNELSEVVSNESGVVCSKTGVVWNDFLVDCSKTELFATESSWLHVQTENMSSATKPL